MASNCASPPPQINKANELPGFQIYSNQYMKTYHLSLKILSKTICYDNPLKLLAHIICIHKPSIWPRITEDCPIYSAYSNLWVLYQMSPSLIIILIAVTRPKGKSMKRHEIMKNNGSNMRSWSILFYKHNCNVLTRVFLTVIKLAKKI